MRNLTKIKKDFEFFQNNIGKTVEIDEIVNFTGRSLSSVKINISKKWYFFLEKQKNGYLILDKVKKLSINDFTTLYEQKMQTRVDELFKDEFKYLDKINISKFYSIKNMEINDLSDKNEVYFLGENGMGKTIILQSIILALNSVIDTRPDFLLKYYIKEKFEGTTFPQECKIFGYGVSRFFPSEYSPDRYGFSTLFDRNIQLVHPLRWLEKVQLIELRKQSSNKKSNYVSYKKVIDFLENIVNIENEKEIRIKETEKSFIFVERGAELEFEQLADGYRSILIWLCDLLSRLVETQPNAIDIGEFKGIVLIDEIDMLLHPKWASVIVKKLKTKLPNIQWIFTTHSPTLIMGATDKAIFYKVYKINGVTKISEPYKKTDFINYMLNGIVTSPLFDLDTARMFKDKKTNQIYTGDFLYEEINIKVKERLMNKPEQIKKIRGIIDDVLNEFEKEGKL